MSDFTRLIDDFCATDFGFHPIDATFCGETAYDAELPPADATSIAREIEAFTELRDRADTLAIPGDAASRLDAHLLRAKIAHRLRSLESRADQHNPAYYTGEVAFAVISLLLPAEVEREPSHLAARIRSIPEFLSGAATLLAGRAIPSEWVRRANTEIAVTSRLLRGTMRTHPVAKGIPESDFESAVKALFRFGGAINDAPPADAACGPGFMDFLIRDVHGIDSDSETLLREALTAFEQVQQQLVEEAARLDPQRTWRQQLARLAKIGPTYDGVVPSYALWHYQAMSDAAELVTPAVEYGLDFRHLPPWARELIDDLYFLAYRSPAALAPGNGSTYWIAAAEGGDTNDIATHNTAAVKMIHAVHHGSIGHHTQNARARAASSRLARIAGTDCASTISNLAAGSLIEGWACYAEELLAEAPTFYSPAERLQVTYFELRNVGGAIADLRFHRGEWSIDDMRRFYREEIAFSPARVSNETARNSIFPTTRLMYWTGFRQIRDLRAASKLGTKAFHDRLLSYGSAPVTWIARELEA
jgi:hypothetical protein